MPADQCHCGCTEIDIDPARGDAVCTQCGSVLEGLNVVSEVQFVQDSGGASRAVGQHLSAGGDVTAGLNVGYHYGATMASREITLRNAKTKIRELASQLKLPDHCIEKAHNFYKIALIKRFTYGRRSALVVAACLYLVCRNEETPHMLLDFSDLIKINVFCLGKVFLQLCIKLCISPLIIDPSIYILRFAHQLQFGDKTHAVSITATRLVHRMRKDWMHTGRRPSGLCGAALLVSARLHNFDRTIGDVIKIVKVSQATVKKRLTEFSDTPSGRLTIDEFLEIDLEEEEDPPVYKKAQKKMDQLKDERKAEKLTKNVSQLQRLIEKALENTKKLKKIPEQINATANADSVAEGSNSSDNITVKLVCENIVEVVCEVIQNNQEEEKDSSLPTEKELNHLLLPHLRDSMANKASAETNSVENETNTDASVSNNAENASKEVPDCIVADGQLDLTGLDDSELDKYIMSSDETKLKSDIWHEINKDYLEYLKEREEKRLKEEEENASKPEKKKRKCSKRVPIEADTAGEAIGKMLHQKKISLKLNYDVLGTLGTEKTQSDNTSEVDHSNDSAATENRPLKRIRSRKKIADTPELPLHLKQGISALVEKNRSVNIYMNQASSSTQDKNQEEMQDHESETQKPVESEDLSKDLSAVQTESLQSKVDTDADEKDASCSDDDDVETNVDVPLPSYLQQYGGDDNEEEVSDYYDDDD